MLGEALKEAYSDIFHLNEKPSQADRQAITGLFKSTHNVSDQVAGFMATTFLCLLGMADISGTHKHSVKKDEKPKKEDEPNHQNEQPPQNQVNGTLPPIIPNLRYNIEIHLPASKDIEVYNAIFKSLKEHLLNE